MHPDATALLPLPDLADAGVEKAVPMTLAELLRAAGHADRVPRDAADDPRVVGVTHDSTRVAPGWVFVAVRGRRDGADFAREAVARGAVAIVAASPDRGTGVPWIVVPDDRAALADLAAAVLGHPSRDLFVLGVTGTNGKTTTADMTETILRESGRPTGLVGTIESRWPGECRASDRTTPEAPDLQALLAAFRDSGCRHAVMEVSSHAVDLARVRGIRFSALAFTNLSQDHLDWHGSLESYYLSKERLFTELAPEAAVAACADDAHGLRLVETLRRRPGRTVITCGLAADSDLRAIQLEASSGGQVIRLVGRSRRQGLPADVDVTTRLVMPGRHNAANAAVAAGLALLAGVPGDEVASGLARHAGVRGRLELVPTEDGGDDVRVLVDYAHTPGALEGALSAARETCAGRLVVVFGCGGDRDKEKRAPMGRVVGALADVAIATSDNPRSEDPVAILAQVQEGLAGAAAVVHVEPDRRAAIALALDLARPGDVVVVAGKGHEMTQDVGGRKLPFDDREVVRETRRVRGFGGQRGKR